MVKLVHLVGGRHVATVDDEDFELVSSFRWYEHNNRGSLTLYAKSPSRSRTLYMHRLVVGDAALDGVVDHIDRNGLNNTRANLRVISAAENATNWERDPTLASHVHHVRSRGRDYYYWHPGRGTASAEERVRLRGEPGSTEFCEQLQNLNATRLGKQL